MPDGETLTSRSDHVLARRAELLDALDKIANPPCAERVQETDCAGLADGDNERRDT